MKIRTTNPKQYNVKPFLGVLKYGNQIQIEVSSQNMVYID